MVNISICSEYNNTTALITHTDRDDTRILYPLFCTTVIFAFHLSNYSSSQPKNSGVKYDKINVHPVRNGEPD